MMGVTNQLLPGSPSPGTVHAWHQLVDPIRLCQRRQFSLHVGLSFTVLRRCQELESFCVIVSIERICLMYNFFLGSSGFMCL